MKKIYKDFKEKRHFAYIRRKARRGQIWNVWRHMMERCLHSKNPAYKNYGGRGIKVCDRWSNFDGFREDMLPTYKRGLSLDRIDNDKGYYEKNCRWATKKEQQNNTRFNRRIEYKDMTKTLTQWAEYMGVKVSTLSGRINHSRWSIDKCLSTPTLDKYHRRVSP